jgi:condensin complex subunit 2
VWRSGLIRSIPRKKDEDGPAIPFNTQFFHDEADVDVPDFDDDGLGVELDEATATGDQVGGTGGEDEDLLAATQGQLKRVRPLFVNYAKKAKRVDVKKLKENIWKGLEMSSPDPKEVRVGSSSLLLGLEVSFQRSYDLPALCLQGSPEPEEPKTFEKVLKGLQTKYPKDKFDDLSTSFCFICLLHLANEQGLRISSDRPIEDGDGRHDDGGDEADEEDEDERRVIGGLETLRIFKEMSLSV